MRSSVKDVDFGHLYVEDAALLFKNVAFSLNKNLAHNMLFDEAAFSCLKSKASLKDCVFLESVFRVPFKPAVFQRSAVPLPEAALISNIL
jgi:hypothetical protein